MCLNPNPTGEGGGLNGYIFEMSENVCDLCKIVNFRILNQAAHKEMLTQKHPGRSRVKQRLQCILYRSNITHDLIMIDTFTKRSHDMVPFRSLSEKLNAYISVAKCLKCLWSYSICYTVNAPLSIRRNAKCNKKICFFCSKYKQRDNLY